MNCTSKGKIEQVGLPLKLSSSQIENSHNNVYRIHRFFYALNSLLSNLSDLNKTIDKSVNIRIIHEQ